MPAAAIGSQTVFVVRPVATTSPKYVEACRNAAAADRGLVAHRDESDRGANAGAQNAKRAVALLLEPAQSAANVEHRLSARLHRQSNVRADEVIRARDVPESSGDRDTAGSS